MQLTKSLIDRSVLMCGSARKLATKLGISNQLITDWRNGKSMPSREEVVEMAFIVGDDPMQALRLLDLDFLARTEKGRAQLKVIQARFLDIGAQISQLSDRNDGPAPISFLCQPVIDKVYIVLSGLNTFVPKMVLARLSFLTRSFPVYQGTLAADLSGT